MTNHYRSKFIFAFCIFVFMASGANAQTSGTASDTQIQNLLKQIELLQAQLATLQGNQQSTPPLIFSRILKLGMEGDDVRQLQTALSAFPIIYPSGKITGYFGPLTEEGVKRFQREHRIVTSGTPETTGFGQVGKMTLAKLNELRAKTVTTTTPTPSAPQPTTSTPPKSTPQPTPPPPPPVTNVVPVKPLPDESYYYLATPIMSVESGTPIIVTYRAQIFIHNASDAIIVVDKETNKEVTSQSLGSSPEGSKTFILRDPGTYLIKYKVATGKIPIMKTIGPITVSAPDPSKYSLSISTTELVKGQSVIVTYSGPSSAHQSTDRIAVINMSTNVQLSSQTLGTASSGSKKISIGTPGVYRVDYILSFAGKPVIRSLGPIIVAESDTLPPTVAIFSPLGGSTQKGTITITATTTDNVGVTGVQFLLDDKVLGSEDRTTPFSYSWNTGTASTGTHRISARARDLAGNLATSSFIELYIER